MQGGHLSTWGTWAAGLSILTGAWIVVAAVAGSLLPAGPAGDRASIVSMDGPIEVRRQTYPLWVERKSPCTNEAVSLDLTLTLEVESRLDEEWIDFVVHAWLVSEPSSSAPDHIEPVSAHFAFTSPRSGMPGNVHQMRSSVLGPSAPLRLALGLEQGTDDKSQLIVRPGQLWLVCG